MGVNASIPAMARPGAVVLVVDSGAFGGAGSRQPDAGAAAAGAPSASRRHAAATPPDPSASRLLRIPEELLLNVLRRVEWGSLAALRATCRATRAAIDPLGVAHLQARAREARGDSGGEITPASMRHPPPPRKRAAGNRCPQPQASRRSPPVAPDNATTHLAKPPKPARR